MNLTESQNYSELGDTLLEKEIEFLRHPGPALGIATINSPAPNSFPFKLIHAEQSSYIVHQRLPKSQILISLPNDINANVRAFYYSLLNTLFQEPENYHTRPLQVKFKNLVYSLRLDYFPLFQIQIPYRQYYDNSVLMKILVEFLQVLDYSRGKGIVIKMIEQYPITDFLFILIIRTIYYSSTPKKYTLRQEIPTEELTQCFRNSLRMGIMTLNEVRTCVFLSRRLCFVREADQEYCCIYEDTPSNIVGHMRQIRQINSMTASPHYSPLQTSRLDNINSANGNIAEQQASSTESLQIEGFEALQLDHFDDLGTTKSAGRDTPQFNPLYYKMGGFDLINNNSSRQTFGNSSQVMRNHSKLKESTKHNNIISEVPRSLESERMETITSDDGTQNQDIVRITQPREVKLENISQKTEHEPVQPARKFNDSLLHFSSNQKTIKSSQAQKSPIETPNQSHPTAHFNQSVDNLGSPTHPLARMTSSSLKQHGQMTQSRCFSNTQSENDSIIDQKPRASVSSNTSHQVHKRQKTGLQLPNLNIHQSLNQPGTLTHRINSHANLPNAFLRKPQVEFELFDGLTSQAVMKMMSPSITKEMEEKRLVSVLSMTARVEKSETKSTSLRQNRSKSKEKKQEFMEDILFQNQGKQKKKHLQHSCQSRSVKSHRQQVFREHQDSQEVRNDPSSPPTAPISPTTQLDPQRRQNPSQKRFKEMEGRKYEFYSKREEAIQHLQKRPTINHSSCPRQSNHQLISGAIGISVFPGTTALSTQSDSSSADPYHNTSPQHSPISNQQKNNGPAVPKMPMHYQKNPSNNGFIQKVTPRQHTDPYLLVPFSVTKSNIPTSCGSIGVLNPPSRSSAISTLTSNNFNRSVGGPNILLNRHNTSITYGLSNQPLGSGVHGNFIAKDYRSHEPVNSSQFGPASQRMVYQASMPPYKY